MHSLVAPCVLLVSLVLASGCGGEGGGRRLPPDTSIDDKPAAITHEAHAKIVFHAVGNADQFTCQLDTSAPAPCSSPFEADVTDGSHAFQVFAALGTATDDTPATASWKVDTVPPDTAIVSGPSAVDNSLAPAFNFQGSDDQGAVTFECALDDAAFAACTSPATAAVVDGSHHYQVRAVDAAGNLDPTPATLTWTVDSTAPDTVITSGPAAGSTTAADVTFAFNSPDSTATLQCSLDGAAFAACTSPRAFTLGDGAHSFAVRARDTSGLVDPTPAMRTWTVDATPPSVMITSTPNALSNTATGTFAFSSTDATAAFACKVDSGAFAACTSAFTTASLPDGGHTFTVRATDIVGNSSTASFSWTIDTMPPTVTVTPVATPTNDATPSVAFTVTGATAIQCRVDTGGFATCTSPFTPAALADGSHTVTVRGTDAAGNPGTGSTTFTVDTTPPPLVFDDAPPALWPVNYFDMKFHSTEATATLACSLNGAAFAACASPLTITTSYNMASSFSVRATDVAGNPRTITTSWAPTNGLVLHYPWEQGRAHNTSLLAQNAAYSPDSPDTVPVVGGWAGTAAGSPGEHKYPGTIRALSSSADGTYTASIWVRIQSSANGGTIFSTLASDNGISLSFAGRTVTLTVNEGGRAFSTQIGVPLDQWVQLGLLATGPGKGLTLLVNGRAVANVAPQTATGFGPGQAPDMLVGSIFGVDLDDLRFYNRALSSSEICSTLVRGQLDASGVCVPLIPGYELDFENNVVRDTGNWGLVLAQPQQFSFTPTHLGDGLKLGPGDVFGYTQGFASRITAAPGHSFSLWYVAGAVASETLLDFFHNCAAGAPGNCGIRVTSSAASGLTVLAGNGSTQQFTRTIAVANGPHSVVVTEQKTANGATQSLLIYVDGAVTALPIGAGNVYGSPSDSVALPRTAGTTIDEYEFWPRDLSLDPEMLCENGWDGEWDPASEKCTLTSN